MKYNDWGEIVNHLGTYKDIAKWILLEGKCIIGWSDDKYDHRDIMFTLCPKYLGGGLQRGLKENYLYVSIIDDCCMGFIINKDTKEGYIREKMHLHDNNCDNKLGHLINEVIKNLYEMREKHYEKSN